MRRFYIFPILLFSGALAAATARAQDETSSSSHPPPPPPPEAEAAPRSEGAAVASGWSVHEQATTVSQGHNSIGSPYSGANSLSANPEYRTSFTGTVFLGKTLWKGGEVYFNPELSAGSGVSASHGVAGFPNGEIYRVDDPNPKPDPARLYLKQVIGFGDETEKLEDDLNQIAATVPVRRLTLVAGRFSLNDFLDVNAYAHDPRTQFLNWAIWENGAWDYAADTRGYAIGFYAELNQPSWAVRYSLVMEPREANGIKYETNVAQAHSNNAEFEERYKIGGHLGKARLLAYANRANMGNYATTIANPAYGMDVTKTRSWSTKYGFGLNLEQEVADHVGSFLRAGWNDGKTETWAFTEIDQTVSFGGTLDGVLWHRDGDVLGLAFAVNGISQDHRNYLQNGGLGFIIGDGTLRYGYEQIAETYYRYQFVKTFSASADLQYVIDPAYNKDRGPATVMALRLHYEN